MPQGQDKNLMHRGHFVQSLSETLKSGEIGLRQVPDLLRRVLSENMWQDRIVPQTREEVRFATFAEFVEAVPPNGLGATVPLLWRMCDGHPDVQNMIDEAQQQKPGKRWDSRTSDNTLYNIQDNTAPTGTSRSRGMRRLRKYASSSPAVAELQEAVLTGQMSVNAALIEAGLRPKTITIPVDPKRAARTIAKQFSPEQVAELVRLLQL